jgi:hypothetical protein
MANDIKPVNVKKATLSDIDLAGLLSIAGLKLEKTSPLTQVKGITGAADSRRLQQVGLLDSNNRPLPDSLEALQILANPDVEMDLIWGAVDRVSLCKVFYSSRIGKLVSFTRGNGSINLSYFLSFQDITDLIAEKTAASLIKESAGISFESTPAALPAFLAVIDLYREEQLKATLERRQESNVAVSVDEVNRIWQDAKTETDFGWYSPAGYIALANGTSAASAKIDEGLVALKREMILNSDGTLNSQTATFASRAWPLMSFFGIKAFTRQGLDIEKAHLALLKGFASLLFVQISSSDSQERVYIKSINTSELPEILFNLITRPFEVKIPPETKAPQAAASASNLNCSKCGTANTAGSKFCSKCGASMNVVPTAKFCPKCGDPVKPEEKFCDKCGNKLV